MNKVAMLNRTRKITLFYMTVLIFFSVYILFKLISVYFSSEIINFKDTVFYELNSDIYTSVISAINPSIEYYIENTSGESALTLNNNYIETLLSNNIPLFSFILNSEEYHNYTINENYPKIETSKESTGNSFEKFEDENFFDTHTLEEQTPDEIVAEYTMAQLHNLDFIKANLYTVDNTVSVSLKDFPIDELLTNNVKVNLNTSNPKVLIYHTHSQENFVDSTEGKVEDTIVGVGDELARILEEEYNIGVIHHREKYDLIDGKLDRSRAYQLVEKPIKDILQKNPSIEILIDLHRDGVPNNVKLATNINGKSTAKIMFFNGLARYKDMPNPYVEDNMSFSLQMQLKANQLYPNFTRKIYLKGLRYNLHLLPNTLLIEAGAQTNTVQEVKNAMEPLAKILYEVIKD